MDAWMNGCLYGWMLVWMDAWMDGCMEGCILQIQAFLALEGSCLPALDAMAAKAAAAEGKALGRAGKKNFQLRLPKKKNYPLFPGSAP